VFEQTFFTSKKEYANNKSEDPFMQALASGGFQVEELARLHYPNGIFINTENYEYDKAVQLTKEAFKVLCNKVKLSNNNQPIKVSLV
jgi:hypothetical protein